MNNNSKPAVLEAFDVCYECTGFTDEDLDGNAFSPMEAEGFTDTLRRENRLVPGLLQVVEGYISEDDFQGSSERKVFAKVTLRVLAANEGEARRFDPPLDLLTDVADAMATGENGENPLNLGRTWYISECDSVDATQNGGDHAKGHVRFDWHWADTAEGSLVGMYATSAAAYEEGDGGDASDFIVVMVPKDDPDAGSQLEDLFGAVTESVAGLDPHDHITALRYARAVTVAMQGVRYADTLAWCLDGEIMKHLANKGGTAAVGYKDPVGGTYFPSMESLAGYSPIRKGIAVIPFREPQIAIRTGAGRNLDLFVVCVQRLPETAIEQWPYQRAAGVPIDHLSEQACGLVRQFMRDGQSNILTDHTDFYTLEGNALIKCKEKLHQAQARAAQ